MISRERILEAAARVYARHGFRGATTRLIANEAGVNEVTLFRTFGSKSAVLQAVLMQHHSTSPDPILDAGAADVESELTRWIDASLTKVRAMRPLLVHCMGEIDERPEAQEFACHGRRMVHETIKSFVDVLKTRQVAALDADSDAAAVMLVGTVMSDAIARSFVPDVFPPIDQAPSRYAKSFLRMIGCAGDDAAPAAPAAPARRARKATA